jgi:hypothetical protein
VSRGSARTTTRSGEQSAGRERGEGKLGEFGREGQGSTDPIYRARGGRGEGSEGGGAPAAPSIDQ